MKTKLISSLLLSLLLLVLVAPQAFALYIDINQAGQMSFYQSSVLGKSDEKGYEAEREDENKGDNINEEYRHQEEEQRHEEERRREEVNKQLEEKQQLQEKAEVKSQAPIMVVPKRDEKTLSVTAEKEQVRVEMSDRKDEDGNNKYDSGKYETASEEELEDRQYLDTDNLEIELSKERNEDVLKLRNKLKEGKQVLELETRNTKATLSEGAVFNLDPETNEVVITTPSGNSHTLYHFPDQTILKMQDSGLLSLNNEGEEPELEIEVQDDGTILYKAENHKTKKLFGLFKRKIPTQVVLNDNTGDVEELESEDRNVFEKILDGFSF